MATFAVRYIELPASADNERPSVLVKRRPGLRTYVFALRKVADGNAFEWRLDADSESVAALLIPFQVPNDPPAVLGFGAQLVQQLLASLPAGIAARATGELVVCSPALELDAELLRVYAAAYIFV